VTIIVLWIGILGGFFGADVMDVLKRRRRHRLQQPQETFTDEAYVEADCRSCGQFNRVPYARLRDRPKCGRCKQRLMPKRRIVICQVNPIDGLLRVELNALWEDEAKLWQCVADHVALQAKASREARNPNLRSVN
jgi:hypothetical protein